VEAISQHTGWPSNHSTALNFDIKLKSVLFGFGKGRVRKSFPNSAEWQTLQSSSAPGSLVLF
jgi:hypothetical protein